MIREGLSNETAKAEKNTDHAEHKFLGQTYYYHKNIMAPDNLGMSPEGTTDALIKNIAGLVNYGKVLITGGGHANAKVNRESRDEPLGDKFFMKTLGECHPVVVDENDVPKTQFYNQDGKKVDDTEQAALCKNRSDLGNLEEGHTCDYIYYKHPDDDGGDSKNKSVSDEKTSYDEGMQIVDLEGEKKDKQKRYLYIDNLPTGTIPGLGTLKGMRGLIPGMIENLGALDPTRLMNSITAPAVPPCVRLNMTTIRFDDSKTNSSDWKHIYSTDNHYVAIDDVAALDPCSFGVQAYTGKNPISGITKNDCPKHPSETFVNLFGDKKNEKMKLDLKNKPIAKLFNMSFGLLMIYLLFKVLKKEAKF